MIRKGEVLSSNKELIDEEIMKKKPPKKKVSITGQKKGNSNNLSKHKAFFWDGFLLGMLMGILLLTLLLALKGMINF